MMHIEVHNGDPLDMVVLDGIQRSAGHVVEDTVAAAIAALCMVTRRPAGQAKQQLPWLSTL